jgi:hypothetical protein
MKRHARRDNALLEKQHSLDEKRGLVMKEMVPPFRGDEFGFVNV